MLTFSLFELYIPDIDCGRMVVGLIPLNTLTGQSQVRFYSKSDAISAWPKLSSSIANRAKYNIQATPLEMVYHFTEDNLIKIIRNLITQDWLDNAKMRGFDITQPYRLKDEQIVVGLKRVISLTIIQNTKTFSIPLTLLDIVRASAIY